MPVIIVKDDYDLCSTLVLPDPAKVADLMKPFDSRSMRVYPVSSTVGKCEECLARVRGKIRSG
jgi:hypothetical protein